MAIVFSRVVLPTVKIYQHNTENTLSISWLFVAWEMQKTINMLMFLLKIVKGIALIMRS